MAPTNPCPECGFGIPGDAPLGLCPACLVAGALSQSANRPAHGPLGRMGKFELIDHLGEGGFGDVYLAEQNEPVQRRVALKVLKRGMDTRAIIARFAEEQQVLANLDHPGICRLIEAGETPDGRPFFAMEFVSGKSLEEFSKLSDLPENDLLTAFRDACRAVAHAHEKGIVHRDLKPSNILVGNDGCVKVIDFGLAKAVRSIPAEVTRTAQVFGTPEYLAPECADGSRRATAAADVFALGKILEGLGCPAGTRPISDRATATDPARRFSDAGQLAKQIDAVLDGDRPVGSHRRRCVVGVVVALLALGTAFYFWSRATNKASPAPAAMVTLRPPYEVKSHGFKKAEDGSHSEWFLFAGVDGNTRLLAFDWNPGTPSAGHWFADVRNPSDEGARLLEWGSEGDEEAVRIYESILENDYTPAARKKAMLLGDAPLPAHDEPLWRAFALQKHLNIRLFFQHETGFQPD